jgi:hypothetical protein
MLEELGESDRRKNNLVNAEKMPLFAEFETPGVANFIAGKKMEKDKEERNKQIESERDKILFNLIEERRKNAVAELEVQQNQVEKLRAEPILIRDDELIASISYTIGYLNGVIYEAELIIRLLKMSGAEITTYAVRKEELERKSREELQKKLMEAIETIDTKSPPQ